MEIFNNETLREAVKEWIGNPADAKARYGHISDWDVSNVTDMSNMFEGAKSFNQDIGKWDVSNVTVMSVMFLDATSFNQDISKWDVSKVTDMSYMFYSAESFNHEFIPTHKAFTAMRDKKKLELEYISIEEIETMAKYKISTKEKNQIVETEFYYKQGSDTVKINIAYRSGWVITTEKGILKNYNPKVGIDVWSLELEDHSFLDGRGDDIEFPDSLPEKEKDRLTDIYYESGTEGLEDEGWKHDDTEVWFVGKLKIEKVGD